MAAVINMVAKELHMTPGELMNESVRNYLEQKLAKVDADIFLIVKKYGIKDVFELDARVKKGFISEKDAYDDYFTLDSLEAERKKIKRILEKF